MTEEQDAGTASDDTLLGLALIFACDLGVKKRGLPPNGFGNLTSIVNIKYVIRYIMTHATVGCTSRTCPVRSAGMEYASVRTNCMFVSS